MNSDFYNNLAYIGIRVGDNKYKDINIDIEDTLISALYKIDTDSRMIGFIFSWIKVHHKEILADKFFRSYEIAKIHNGASPWFSACCAYLMELKDFRFKKGITKIKSATYVGNRNQNAAIKMKGAIDYLEKLNIMIPNGNIRIRESDVFTKEELVKKNIQYRNRVVFGSNWRAEIFTAISNGAKNSNQVAKKLGIQRGRVGVVFKDYQLIKDLIKF